MLKKRVLGKGHGHKIKGAGKLKVDNAQEMAIEWLTSNISAGLKERVKNAGFSGISASAFEDKATQELFGNLIGELVGDFDLIIIDEAHKSRAGADLGKAEKKATTDLQSRLTKCLNYILLRPHSKTRQAKRVALTATPMEMDSEQWASILCRLGFSNERVENIMKIVERFSGAVSNFQVGSQAEIDRLETAAAAFQSTMHELVTRRLWRDHPSVQKFAASQNAGDVAHPHRKFISCTTALSTLTEQEKLQLAIAESIAATSKGMTTAHTFKSAGSRFSQGLPLAMEASVGKTASEKKKDSRAPKEKTESEGTADTAQAQRQQYWLRRLGTTAASMGRLAEQAQWSLQWHPRVQAAIRLIESLTRQGEKVLVFGEFIDSMRALDRALNIRYYLQHVRENQPIPVPSGIKADDPDLLCWLESPDLAFSESQKQSFHDDSEALSARYISDRADLRAACQATVDRLFDPSSPASRAVSEELKYLLVTWLVQQLCVSDRHVAGAGSTNVDEIAQVIESMLLDLRDADPAAQEQDDDEAEETFDWAGVIRELAQELEIDQSGKPVFRMSPFSQLLYGNTKTPTRRVRQSTFNNHQLNPQVLIGQSSVASEGLNLHRACRSVVLFHLDWNPGRIEQQIGRVDRQDSHWMADFENWNGVGDVPFINVYTLAIEGTYDAFRTAVVQSRAKVLRSQLFGEILPLEQLDALDEHARDAVRNIKVDFRPI